MTFTIEKCHAKAEGCGTQKIEPGCETQCMAQIQTCKKCPICTKTFFFQSL